MRPGHGLSALLLFAALCLAGLTLHAAAPPASKAPVAAMTFSPDGVKLVVGRRASFAIYNVASRRRERSLDCAFPKITSLAFSTDGRTLFVTGGVPGAMGGLQLFDWPGGQLLQTLTNRTDMTTAVAASPSGDRVAVAGADHEVTLFNFDSIKRQLLPAQCLADHSRPVLAAMFGPDGKQLVTASADRSIKVWEVGTGSLIRSFSHHTDIVHGLALRPAAGDEAPFSCASGSDDRTVRVWQPGIGRMVRIIRRHEGAIFALTYSRDGARLFSAGKEGVIRMIDADSDEILQQWTAHTDWIYSLAVSPDGATLVSGDWAGNVKLWATAVSPGRLLGALD